MTEEALQTGFDPNDRELCPDGACIGVIGADGRCAECGKGSARNVPSAGRKEPRNDQPPISTEITEDSPTPPGPREVEGDAFDPDRRELCPDGACIGVIGADGRCAECGKSSADGPRSTGRALSTQHPDAEADSDDGDEPDSMPATTSPDGEPEVEERELCTDGACIGVIGSNGRCKVCGTRAK